MYKSILLLVLFSILPAHGQTASIGACHVESNHYQVAPIKRQFINAEFGGVIKVNHVTLIIPPNALSTDQMLTLNVIPIDEQTKHIAEKLELNLRWQVTVKAQNNKVFNMPLTIRAKPLLLPLKLSNRKAKQRYVELSPNKKAHISHPKIIFL